MPNLASHQDHRRRMLLADVPIGQLRGLEIGALDDPIVRRLDGPVLYVDHAPRAALVDKYTGNPAIDVTRIVDVDVVWGDRPLAELIGKATVDYVIASHVAEHIPDLVGWLRELQAVLRPGGQIMLVLPDKRMSYDCLRRETGIVEVLDAFVRQAKRPQTYQLLDCALGVVQSSAYDMHVNNAPPDSFPPIHTIESALHLARHALEHGVYIDIHCWSFTPKSISRLMYDLNRYGLINLACSGMVETAAESNWEFFVKFKTGSTQEEALRTWQDSERAALDFIQGSAAARANPTR